MNAFVAQTPTHPARHASADAAAATPDGADAADAAPWLYRSEGFAEDLDDSYFATH